jgi:uncharacterized protein YbaR (Trm112 family)
MSDSKQREEGGRDQRVISDELRKLLVCPVEKAALRLTDSTLVCTVCQRVYPIEQGIPQMLVDGEK